MVVLFKIRNAYVQTRKLKAPSAKIILALSNILPIIPNSVIDASLTQMDLKPMTPISILRFNSTEDIFTYVISMRRQFCFPPETEVTKIRVQPMISITHDESTYRIIFFTNGDFVYFKCG